MDLSCRVSDVGAGISTRLAFAMSGAGFRAYASVEEAYADLPSRPGAYVFVSWIFVLSGAATDVRSTLCELAARSTTGACYVQLADSTEQCTVLHAATERRLAKAELVDIGRQRSRQQILAS